MASKGAPRDEQTVQLIRELYKQFRPEKLEGLDDLLASKYPGAETEFYEAACAKYGVPPAQGLSRLGATAGAAAAHAPEREPTPEADYGVSEEEPQLVEGTKRKDPGGRRNGRRGKRQRALLRKRELEEASGPAAASRD